MATLEGRRRRKMNVVTEDGWRWRNDDFYRPEGGSNVRFHLVLNCPTVDYGGFLVVAADRSERPFRVEEPFPSRELSGLEG
jgi:hypothetical protein